MTFLGRRVSSAHVLAGIAIVFSCAGSATAAALITGASVKDSSLTGRDLRDGSVTGKDVKDRSIALRDLAANVRGRNGPAGPVGAQGPAGVAGRDGAPGPIGQPTLGLVDDFSLAAKTAPNPWITIPGAATRILQIPSANTIIDGSVTVGLGSSIAPLQVDVHLCYRAAADDPPLPFTSFPASAQLAEDTSVPIVHETARTFAAGTWRIAPCIRHGAAVALSTVQTVDLGGPSIFRLVVDPTY